MMRHRPWHQLGLLLAGIALVGGCSASDPAGATWLPIYAGPPTGDDAAFGGVLTRVGDCLYLDNGPGQPRMLLLLPEGSSFDESRGVLRVGGKLAVVGVRAGV